ncbi:hypothetical protein [Nocardia brasiliensis]|uniref:hypothetical protein n=1 Tax=Nocardia brasiliensis TaxID=37326 RepID=UPI003D8A7A2B
MPRVEWSLLAGEEVEALVGMLLCSEMPTAQRVRPSQGDGGIDVFVPGDGGAMVARSVYQAKKFAATLNSSQKRQIKRSFDRVRAISTSEGWTLTDWHLVCPLIPTPANVAWFDEMTRDVGFPCTWMDLDRLNLLASSYPAVIDWYLHDGRQRLTDAIEPLAAIIARRADRQPGQQLTTADVHSDLVQIYRAVNVHDPHYRYAIEVSHQPPTRADPPDPGLVAVIARRTDAIWVITKIYARSLASLEERPIPIELRISVPTDRPDLREQWQRYVDYGTPVTMPAGTVRGTFDLPAGFGGEIIGGQVQLLPLPVEQSASPSSDEHELILGIVDPDDNVVAELLLERSERTVGSAGVRTLWRDTTALLSVEMLAQFREPSVELNISLAVDIMGRRPTDLGAALDFCAALHEPNRAGLSPAFGPRRYSGSAAHLVGERNRTLVAAARTARALAAIQPHVTQRLLMPRTLSEHQAHALSVAAKVLSGQPVWQTWASLPVMLNEHESAELSVGDTHEFCVVHDLAIELDNDTIIVGQYAALLHGRVTEVDDTRVQISPVDDLTMLVRFTGTGVRDGTVLYRNRPAGEAASDDPAAEGG